MGVSFSRKTFFFSVYPLQTGASDGYVVLQRTFFCRVVCESLKINGCALLVDDVLRCILCGGHR